MKKLVLLGALVLFSFGLKAQTSLGGGVLLASDATALELNSEFGIADGKFTISPSFDYYLGLPEGASLMSFNAEGHYNLGDATSLNYYPLAGLGYMMISVKIGDISISTGTTAFILGGGLSYALSDGMKLVGELKYYTAAGSGGLGLHAGILFNIGG